ncbi:MAG: SLC13 family permease, partial [Pseudomonadota bacterium]|nr:SLC13 family permease [Pseudomonadota bacterium]
KREVVEEYARENVLEINPELDVFAESLSATSAGIAEIVIPPDSSLIGKTLKEIGLRDRYNATVLSVYRINEVIDSDLPNLRIQAGDTLVVHVRWRDLGRIAGQRHDFALVTDYPRDDTRPEKLKYAMLFFVLTLVLVLFSDLRLSLALMVGAVGMILSGVIRIDEAYRAIGWQSVFLLASLIPLGVAVENSGSAAWIAQETLRLMGDVPQWVMQAAIAILATVFTLVMSNVGATVLLVPLAVNIALGVGADPAMYALTVALATSNSFLIPTHQVNALIMGPGGYKVADFLRAGGFMTILFLVVMLVMLNLVF